jgi:hypothetical protein
MLNLTEENLKEAKLTHRRFLCQKKIKSFIH